MSAPDQDLDALFKRLHLANARRVWRDLVQRAERETWSYGDFLTLLVTEEIAHRQQTRLGRLTRRAHFPFLKTIDDFNFTYQSSLRLHMLGSAFAPDFVTEGRSLIFSGKPGRGKTHLAIAVAYRAIQNGFDAVFTTAATLIDDLSAAFRDGQLAQALQAYTHPAVLVVDEVGYLTYGTDAANMLFHVVNERHRRHRPMIFTTNKALKAWGRVLHDEDLAQAIIDRVLERGRLIRLDGPSVRTLHLKLDEALKDDSDQDDEVARISGNRWPEFPQPTNRNASELQQEVLVLRRRVKKLTALLRLAVALLRTSGFRLTHERLPEGPAKIRILRAVDRARAFVPLRALLRFLGFSPSRFHAWRRRQHACTLDDQSSCPHTSPHRLTTAEIRAIKDMVTAVEYRHVPTGTLAVLAQRLGKVWASPSTWYNLVRKFGWRRPRLRVHPAKPKVGIRTMRANEMWHIDTTVIRLLDGTRAYLHAVIDNFSRRILAWRVAETFAPVNSVAVLVEAGRAATPSETTPVVLADAGVENVNAHVDELITTGVLRRVLAFTELKFSNSMIEAWWRSLKHHWLFLHSLDSVTTVRRLVQFYVQEHNQVLPHSAFRGQTPDEMYFGTGDAVPGDLTTRAAAARKARGQANRSAACGTCPPTDAAA